MGKAGNKPLVGLPGHPVAAYFITKLFVLPLLSKLTGRKQATYTTTAKITENISANHGRAQYHCCRLERRDGELLAYPIRGKSGLITTWQVRMAISVLTGTAKVCRNWRKCK